MATGPFTNPTSPQQQLQQTAPAMGGGLAALTNNWQFNRPNPALMALGAGVMGRNTAAGFARAGQLMQDQQGRRDISQFFTEMGRPDLAKLSSNNANAAIALYGKNAAGSKPIVKTLYDEKGMAQPHQFINGKWEPIGNPKAPNNTSMKFNAETGEFEFTQGQQGFGTRNAAKEIAGAREQASDARKLRELSGLLRSAGEQVTTWGPGSGAKALLDDFIEANSPWEAPKNIIGGSSGPRAVVSRGSVQFALEEVGKTKGAVSDREMGLFLGIAPGMMNTKEGFFAIVGMIEAMQSRLEQEAIAKQKWYADRQTLDGFNEYWGSILDANPLIVTDQGTLRADPSRIDVLNTPQTLPGSISPSVENPTGALGRIKERWNLE
jgi:hypothetical protein